MVLFKHHKRFGRQPDDNIQQRKYGTRVRPWNAYADRRNKHDVRAVMLHVRSVTVAHICTASEATP